MQNDLLAFIQHWYSAKCDGVWEHSYGFDISTLDNPGWSVKISGEQNREALSINIENDESDWLIVNADGNEFNGYGGPKNLSQILQHACDWLNYRPIEPPL